MSAEGFTGLGTEVRLAMGINIAGVNAGMTVGFLASVMAFSLFAAFVEFISLSEK